MNLQNIDQLINKKTEKKYYIESVTYCFPYDIKHTFHGDYGPLLPYIGKSRAVSRDEIDRFICEMIMHHPFVPGSMRLDINIMCREQKNPVAAVTSFYHSLSFKNDAYKEQQKGDMTIQYEKPLQKDFSLQQEDIEKE